MKRAVVMADKPTIDAADLELTAADAAPADLDIRAARLRAEREVLDLALARSHHTLSVAARMLGVSRPTLYGLMQIHGIPTESAKSDAAEAGVHTEAASS